ncbi:MAG: PEP-CTERM sorting domain-containing protein [Phycisphaerae bacterium]|nr:PEP-CTERM sorting domain-containing protein [Phycisphaerae bacterium]
MRAMVRFCAGFVLCVAGGNALAGPDWVELGDAGSFPDGAQVTVGQGNLGTISGTLSEGLSDSDYEDLYFIRVTNPKTFKFDLRHAAFDTQVFIFEIGGDSGEGAFGLLGNNDGLLHGSPVMGSLIDGPANDGSGARIYKPGLYLLAITGFGRVPMSYEGPIFRFDRPTEISGPDGYGGDDPLSHWYGRGAVGGYRIELEGVGFSQVPAPSALAALGLAGALLARRRR